MIPRPLSKAVLRAAELEAAWDSAVHNQQRAEAAEALAERERARADDHDSARQSEKERADYAEAKLAEALKNNDPASYSSMVYWREKCYEARAEVERWKSEASEAEFAAEAAEVEVARLRSQLYGPFRALDDPPSLEPGVGSEKGLEGAIAAIERLRALIDEADRGGEKP